MKVLYILLAILMVLLASMFMKVRREYFVTPSDPFTHKKRFNLTPQVVQLKSKSASIPGNSYFGAIQAGIYGK